jgi:hypothetical protein
MPSLFDVFRFTANDGTGDQSLAPLVSGLKRRWERTQDGRDYRIKLSSPLLFKGADYAYFRAIYDAGECAQVNLLIEVFCGGSWETWYTGTVPIGDGDYNASRCEVSFDIQPADVYQCANKGFDKKANWLEYGTPTNIKTFVGTIETITCTVAITPAPGGPDLFWFAKQCWGTGFTNSSDPDPALAWRPINHTQGYLLTGEFDASTTWAREKTTSATPPIGDGWINISGTTWVRPVNVGVPVIGKSPLPLGSTWQADPVNPAPISNGRKLADVLTEAVNALDCDIDQVVSNFFGINPDGSAPANDAYSYAEANFQNVFFFQKSDIVRASATNDATRFETTLKEFFDEIKVLHVFWAITEVGGVKTLRVEHYTYFDGSNGLDLTTTDGGKYIAGLDRFKSKEQVPAFEQFGYQESFRPKFLTQRIDYPANCVNAPFVDRSTRLLCCDFGGLVENNDAGTAGFFLMATVEQSAGVFLINSLGGEPNGAFAWENLLPALWADGRYHADATATVPGYTVNSVRKYREQGPITIKFSPCASFEPSELVKTQIGWGEVNDAEQNTERGTLTITLLQ